MSASQSSPKDIPSARFTERRTSPRQNVESGYTRPSKPASAPVPVGEETTLEKIWGRLFDEAGHPTARLGEFLRGLAVHLIEDYEPKKSLVVTPVKMAKFYDAVQLKDDVFNWQMIFQKMSNSDISHLYRDLGCQHHLVQERHDEAPHVPGLTPHGFERWMTLLIQVQPDDEHERLAKAVLNMPISNADKPTERFPKEISRRLFPAEPDPQTRDRFERTVKINSESSRAPPKGSSSYESPLPPPPPRTSGEPKVKPVPPPPSTMPPGFEERERKPYGKTPATTSLSSAPVFETSIDGNETDAPEQLAQPLERERKPYSAAPGGGKLYDDTIKSRPGRANSTSSKTRPVPINTSGGRAGEVPIPEAPPARNSTSAHPPHLGGGQRRPRTPSIGTHDYRHSEGDLLGYQATVPFDLDEDNRRYAREAERRNNEWARKQAEEEARIYESPRDRERYDRASDFGPRRGYEDDWYRGASGGRGSGSGSGYEYSAPYPPSYR
ncbi:hypothetical protein L228DRAFT_34106 [Xylona heveae TC161]|uniref:DUF7514 domain-containing protein n=1 Tax=Xylona heveae (strain CBS 132557 / TC161) TaxID=1328760 RepID=A0A165A6U2_XYLHT|nr:hypothetical protein L228DRAFT_34106 [Xylona heveae TC161]KZF20034.1 hypothetical protein L228DRAFT_34106 [Xylona heveae TC161]